VGTADFRTKVIAVIEALRSGEVVSYGDVAAQAGHPGAARAVGAVLRTSGDDGLPWWRVVMSTGRLAPGKEAEQGRRLRAEGVAIAMAHAEPGDFERLRRAGIHVVTLAGFVADPTTDAIFPDRPPGRVPAR